MIDYHKELVSALNDVLPAHHELALTGKEATPCISYQERDNADTDNTGDTIGYSRISFTVKVWSKNIAELQAYSREVDTALRPLGFKRVSANELGDKASMMKQKILTYECLALEIY